MVKRLGWSLIVFCTFVRAAAAQPPPAAPAATPVADEGIPVQSELVKSKCGGCHKSDDKGRMTRISYRRASPENWTVSARRGAVAEVQRGYLCSRGRYRQLLMGGST